MFYSSRSPHLGGARDVEGEFVIIKFSLGLYNAYYKEVLNKGTFVNGVCAQACLITSISKALRVLSHFFRPIRSSIEQCRDHDDSSLPRETGWLR